MVAVHRLKLFIGIQQAQITFTPCVKAIVTGCGQPTNSAAALIDGGYLELKCNLVPNRMLRAGLEDIKGLAFREGELYQLHSWF